MKWLGVERTDENWYDGIDDLTLEERLSVTQLLVDERACPWCDAAAGELCSHPDRVRGLIHTHIARLWYPSRYAEMMKGRVYV